MIDILRIFMESVSDQEAFAKINRLLAKEADAQEIRSQYADEILEFITRGLHKYGNISSICSSIYFKEFEVQVSKLSPAPSIFQAFMNLVLGKHDAVMENVRTWIDEGIEELDGPLFVDALVLPLKEGFPGMWTQIGGMLRERDALKGLADACDALETVYHATDPEEAVEALTRAHQANPDLCIVKELLGYTYYNMGMWKNAIAWFEQQENQGDDRWIFYPDEIFFWMGWAYGKTKNLQQSEVYYRKALEANAESPNSLNNLGYCLYQQKRYKEAQAVFEQCMKEERDLSYARNNMVRVLLASGQYAKACAFVKANRGHIAKDLIRRTEQAQGRADLPEPDAEPAVDEEAQSERKVILGARQQQFSSERILEDELVRRIENGLDVFGFPLSMFQGKGAYGRQYIIPVGRLDILAVDPAGNLYAIELKRGSCADVYEQVTRYTLWLEENLARPGKKVYGIIVVNEPGSALIEKVRKDPKVRLYSYNVSYTEIG